MRNCKKRVLSAFLALLMLVMIIPVGVLSTSAAVGRKIVNVVFILDATGSMGDEISNVRKNVKAFTNYLDSKSGIDDLRLSLIEYKDTTADGIHSTVVYKSAAGTPWFENVDEFIRKIDSIYINGGGDGPETVFDGMGYMVCDPDKYADAVPFNSDAYKFAFVLTDADYKNDNRFGITGISDMVNRLVENDICTSMVTPGGYKSTYSDIYTKTGGIWIDIYSDFSIGMIEFADNILDVVKPEEVDIALAKGDTYNFKTLAETYLDEPEKATYVSSDNAILSFSAAAPHLGTANKAGKCTVTISDGSKQLICNVEITDEEPPVPVKELKISTELIVGVDMETYIKAIALPAEASNKGLNWSVADSSIVQIIKVEDNRCYLKGLKSGTTRLNAVTKDGGYSGGAEITVTVEKVIPVTGVEISMRECTLNIGESKSAVGSVMPATATNKGGYWYSTNSDVVAIVSSDDKNCTFKAISCGEAQIVFTSNEGDFSKAITVKVPHKRAAEGVVIKESTTEQEGEMVYLCEICGAVIEKIKLPMLPKATLVVEGGVGVATYVTTVSFKFEKEVLLNSLGITDLEYDRSALKLLRAGWTMSDAFIMDDWNGVDGVVAYEEDTAFEGVVFTADFLVRRGTPVGEYKITCATAAQRIEDPVDVPVMVESGVIRVIRRGDLDDDGDVDAGDAIYCLRHVLFSARYPANQDVDFNGDGAKNAADAVHLLRYVLFPTRFQLSEGYVDEPDLTFVEVNETVYVKAAEMLNLRSEPSLDGEIIGIVTHGTALACTGKAVVADENGIVWYRVHYNGITCYVHSGYLSGSFELPVIPADTVDTYAPEVTYTPEETHAPTTETAVPAGTDSGFALPVIPTEPQETYAPDTTCVYAATAASSDELIFTATPLATIETTKAADTVEPVTPSEIVAPVSAAPID